jgi:glyoxylase-like metal-dependent hydrolase (beta-lactamase superfamily II)
MSGMWNETKAVDYAQKHEVGGFGKGQCAEHVRQAIQAGGITLNRHLYAKDYGKSLEFAGFQAVQGAPIKGDVVVIQPAPGHPDGHMAIFDGTHWVSDFIQIHGLYPGPSYRNAKPKYIIYRHY